jgi:hypothetical protein
MSPQQAAGKNKALDGRSDQFSLGLILFELLTLKPAFHAPNAIELIKKVLKVELQPFEPFKGDVPIPRELAAITLKALGRKPDLRYANVAEMAEDIRRWQAGKAVKAQPDTAWQRAIRWIGHHRQATLAAGFAVLLLSLLGVSASVYRQQAELARSRAYSSYVNALSGQVASQAQRIDSHFLAMQGLLGYLAGAAIQSVEQGKPSDEPYFLPHPFKAPNHIQSSLFGGKISLDWPTTGFSPGKSNQDMHGKLLRLLPLRHVFREVVLRSQSDHPEKLRPEQIQSQIATSGTPIMWAHVSLEEGVIYMYPGIGYNNPTYDARTRPFYKMAAHKHGSFWGSPYFDPLSGALLPCTTALYDRQGRFIGVAGIDLRFQYIIDHLLSIRHPDVRQSYLLNAQGQIIIRSQAAKASAQAPTDMTKGFDTPAYPDADLQAAIKARKPGGYLEQGDKLLLYSRLNTLGWYLVVEAQSGQTDSVELPGKQL